jgi:hypothetical protein
MITAWPAQKCLWSIFRIRLVELAGWLAIAMKSLVLTATARAARMPTLLHGSDTP